MSKDNKVEAAQAEAEKQAAEAAVAKEVAEREAAEAAAAQAALAAAEAEAVAQASSQSAASPLGEERYFQVVTGYQLWCPTQSKYAMTGGEKNKLVVDSWVTAQVEAGLLVMVDAPVE